MQPTRFLRGAIAGLALSLSVTGRVSAQVLFSNGPVVDAETRSVVRPNGGTTGFDARTGRSRVADDFTVGAGGWTVSGFNFFAYQVSSANEFTFTGVTWSIVSGDVRTGSVVASGAAVPTNGGLIGYRVSSSTLTAQDRAIFQLGVDVPDFALSAGTYWLRWSIEGSLASGPWQPPTSDGVVGNAQGEQFGQPFAQLRDGTAQGVELPFQILGPRGGPTTPVPEPSAFLLLAAGGLAMVGIARRRQR